MKNVIHIYGASGSGTSTLGRKTSEELGYKFMDADDYFWLPTNPRYTTKRSKEERLALMKKDISDNDNVVISGSLVDWGDELIPLFTLAIRLVTDTEIRTTRLKEREKQKNFKKVQKEMNSVIGRTVTVTVDRPLGSYHPEHEDMYYPINYGYVEGIMAPDGEEQDAYILGVDEAVEKFTGTVIAVVHRNDDVEEKWVVVPEGMTFTKEEIMKQIYFQEQYFDSKIMV